MSEAHESKKDLQQTSEALDETHFLNLSKNIFIVSCFGLFRNSFICGPDT